MRFERCLESTGKCNRKPIRAHSIQNARVLEQLCRNGHVVMIQRSHDKGRLTIGFRYVGRNTATTFAGLCAIHDSELFQPIEDEIVNLGNKSNLFLLAYRAVIRELHTCIDGAVKNQAMYLSRVQLGLSPADRPDFAGRQATERLSNAYDANCYKEKYDKLYFSRDYSTLRHHILTFEHTCRIAVNSTFSLDNFEWTHDDVARICLNIFPMKGRTHIIFSFLEKDAPVALEFLNHIIVSEGFYQKYVLSKIVLQHCENFVIAPDYYESMSEKKKQAILQFCCDTIHRNLPEYENQDLYLF